jgi:hypothetical protein
LFELPKQRCRGEHDGFSYPQPRRLGDSDGRARLTAYPNRDTATDRDTVTEDQVRGNETLMRVVKRRSRPCPSTLLFHIVSPKLKKLNVYPAKNPLFPFTRLTSRFTEVKVCIM